MSLTISAASVNDLIADPSSITGYSTSTAIVIEGQITTTQASQLNTVVAPSITATVAPAAASVLSAITVRSGRTNAFTLTPTETSATASVLKGVKDKTSLNGDFSNVTTIAASPSADITALFAPLDSDGTSANSTFAADITINVSDTSIAASTLNAINALTTTAIVTPATTITGGASDVKSALGDGVTHEDDVAVTITESTTNAALLNDVNGATDGLVTVQSTTVTGTYAAVNTALAASAVGSAIAGMSAINVTLTAANGTAASYTPTEINTIDGLTTGTITASVNGDNADGNVVKAVLLHADNGIQNLDGTHILTVPALTDTSISGAELLQLDAATTLPITVTAATTITGTYADIVAAYAANTAGTIVGLGNEAITVTGGITVAQANTLNALTPGVVTAVISTTDMATLAGLTLNLDSNGAQVLDGDTPVENVYTITPADTTVAASALTALNSKAANGTAIDATAITTVTGTLAEVVAIYASGGIVAGISNLGDEAITITDTGSLNADQFQTINTRTTGVVTASGTVTNLTGSAANVKAVLAADNAATDDGNDLNEGTALTDNPTVTVTGDTAAAADLIDIDSLTTGLVTVNSTTITGTKEHIATVLAANAANPVDADDNPTFNTITGLATTGANAVNLTISNAVPIADLDDYTGATTGVVTATVTGTVLSTLLTDANKAKIGTGNVLSFSVETALDSNGDATDNILASELIELNSLTSAGSILCITDGSIVGTEAELRSIYALNTDSVAGPAAPAGAVFSGLEHEPVTVTGTSLTAEGLLYIDGKTDQLVTHTATHLSGLAADIVSVFTADHADNNTISGTTANTILTATDSTIAAGGVNGLVALNTASSKTVISTATTISGAHADVYAALLANNDKKLNADGDEVAANANGSESIDGLDAVNVTLTVADGETAAEVKLLNALTTGTISGKVSNTAVSELLNSSTGIQTLSGVHDLDFSIADGILNASDLATLNAKTSGQITVNSTTLLGTASDVKAAYADLSSGILNLNNENVTISGGISVADFNSIAEDTSGLVTATITDTDSATLKTIAEAGHNLTVTIADTTATVADITAIDALTASDVTVTSGTISGSHTELAALEVLKAAGTVVYGNPAMTITNSVTAAQANVVHAYTTGLITATISDTTEALLDDLTGTGANANAYTITLSETSYTGADLIAINDRTTLPVDASAVTTLTGDADKILTCLVENSDFDTDYTTAKARTITGLDDVAVTIDPDADTATIAEIFGMEKLTTGLITATVTAGGVNQGLDHLIDSTSGIGLTNPNNAISVTVNDGGDAGGDTEIQTITAADLLTLNSRTTGLITVAVTTITGSVADLKTAFAANDATAVASTQITGLQADAVTVTYAADAADTSISATDLNILDDATTGLVTFTNATSLTGVGALDADGESPVLTALTSMNAASPGVAWGAGDAANDVPVTLTGNVSVADANTLAALTGGSITATITEGDIETLATLRVEENAYTITVTDATVSSEALEILNIKSSVAIDASAVTTLTGPLDHIGNVYTAAGLETPTITGLGNENLTISGDADGNALTPTEVNTASGYTTGVITATVEASTIAEYNAITETGNVLAFDVEDDTVVAATLNNLRAKTTGVVNVRAATINGSLSDIAALYSAQTAGTVTGLGAEAIGITNTGTVAAADLNVIDGINATAFSAATVTGLTGTATAINAAYASSGITGLANEAVTITGTSTAAADITTADGNTSGVVTVNSSTITGTRSEIVALYTANAAGTVAGLGNEAITISDSITTAQANVLDAYTTGAITATITDGAIDNLATLTGTNNAFTINVTDTTVSASNLNALDAKTSSAINVTATAITGTAADLIATYAAKTAGTLTGLGSETVTVTSAGKTTVATASDLGLISFDATSYLASHTDVLAALGSTGNTALTHYLDYGYSESRSTDTFSELSYIASYSDLITAFGTDGSAGTAHFVSHGYSEGRSADNFDELGYVASYADLITAIGASATGAATHYINYGSTEGRTATFDAAAYLANYADLSAAFGSDQELAKQHYINYGYNEGRTVA